MQLIQATEKDAQLLADIHEESFPNYWNVSDFNNFFTVENTFAVIVQEGETAAGMTVWRIQYDQADIITLAVRPGHRRQGIARIMLEYMLGVMQRAGVKSIFLDVENGNQPAISLYEAYGFSYLRRRRLYYRQKDGTYTDALVMTKKFS